MGQIKTFRMPIPKLANGDRIDTRALEGTLDHQVGTALTSGILRAYRFVGDEIELEVEVPRKAGHVEPEGLEARRAKLRKERKLDGR